MYKADKNNLSREKIVDYIVEQYTSLDELPDDLEEMIREWLANDHDGSLKEEALMKVFEKDFRLADRPSKQLLNALPELKQRLGMSDKLHKIPLYKKAYFKVASVAAVIIIIVGIGFNLQKGERSYTPSIALNPVIPAETEETYTPFIVPDTVMWMENKELHIPSTSSTTIASVANKGSRRIELADGSQIWLGENSTVEYPDDFLNDRTVILKGEAYFSVVKMDGKPFQVKADDLTVRVLGTEFFVRTAAENGQTEVSLSSGRVEIINERYDIVYELSPQEQLLLDNITNEVIRNIVDDEYIVKYKTEVEILPEPEPEPMPSPVLMLYDVFSKIANAYNVQFEIEDSLDTNTEIIINVDNTLPLEELLSLIQMVAEPSFDFSINESESTVRVTKK